MGEIKATLGILAPDELPAVEVANAQGSGPAVIVCEHASAFIPVSLGGLGLAGEARLSHAAWDPGAIEVARHLARHFDSPLVAARISRLVYDCNRPPESPAAMPERSETIVVPGNRGLGEAARAARVAEVYEPFRSTLAATLGARPAPPVMLTVHTFTPVWFGAPRTTEVGLLHDADDRLARAMYELAPGILTHRAELNRPYGPEDGVTHTLREHALPRGLLNVMIEVRNDLVATPEAQARAAAELAKLVERALPACNHGDAAGSVRERTHD